MAGLTNHSMIKTARDAKVLARLGQSHAITTETKTLKAKMMLLGLFAAGILFAAMQLQAAENWYEKSYKPQNSSDLKSMQANPDTKMYVSNHKEDDDISMLESGYDMIGSSGFTAGDVPAEQALEYAKKIKADTVLVYSKYGSAKTAISKMQMIKEAAKVGKELSEKDLQDEPTNYKYYASYWAKLPAPLLGVHVIKLAKKESQDAEKATEFEGLKVIAVIKDSPAAKAGLLRGDTLLKLAGNKLNKPEELSAMVRQHQGKEVELEFERNGEKSIANAQINARK